MLTVAHLWVAGMQAAPLRRPAAPALVQYDRSWSNPQGSVLTQIHDDVWLAERPFYPRLPGLQGTDVGCKACVVRLPTGKLWVHAPVGLDPPLVSALAELGEVGFIVTPNTEHQLYAPSWILAYPSAKAYACPGLRDKKPEVGWGESLDALLDAPNGLTAAAPPAEWEGVIDLCWVRDKVPLTPGIPFFNEVVFLHRPSRTLIVTDLWWNYPAGENVPTSSRVWKWAMDTIYRPVYNRLMRTPTCPDSYRAILDWDFQSIAPCHGEPVAEGGRKILAEHLALEAR